jgi:sugar phosphate isomerase/epimerase
MMLLALALAASEFFALDTAMVKNLAKDLPTAADVDTVAELGYPGIAVVVPNEAAWKNLRTVVLPALDRRKLKLYGIYSRMLVTRERCVIDPEIARALPELEARGAVIWLATGSKEFKSSDTAADPLIVDAVSGLARQAAQHHLSISLYPHMWDLVARTTDAVRLAGRINLPNVGVTFNLCHALKADGFEHINEMLEAAAPRLNMVTINGADRDGKEWIQPLDSGNFDVAALLARLAALGYRGPIGLQGYAVATRFGIEPRENLRRSMEAWRRYRPR